MIILSRAWRCALAIAPLLLFAAEAAAQQDLSQGGATIAQTLQGMISSLRGQEGKLLSEGTRLAGILTLLMVSWYGLMSVLESGELHQVMGGLLRAFILYGLVAGILAGYGSGGALDPIRFIVGSLDVIKGKLSSTGEASLGSGLANFILAMTKLAETKDVSCTGWDCLTFLATGIPTLLYKLIAAVALVVGAVFYAGYYMLGEMMTSVGIILGPIMIPWLILPPAAWLFNSWVKFMITASMYIIIANIMVDSTNKMLETISVMSGWNSPAQILYSSMLMMIASMLVAFLMMQISSMATGLVSGSANASVNARMLGSVTGGVGGVGQVARGAATGGAAVGGAIKGGTRGTDVRGSDGSTSRVTGSAGARHGASQWAGKTYRALGGRGGRK
jgi:hypothetical protein